MQPSEASEDSSKITAASKQPTDASDSANAKKQKPAGGSQTALPVKDELPVTSEAEKIDLYSKGEEKYPFMKRLFGLAQTISKVIVNIKKFPFTETHYDKYIKKFAAEGQKYSTKKAKYMDEIQRALFVAQISDDQHTLYLIEKLLIQLMGFCDLQVRDQAVVLLNMLYDEVDWQLQEAFRPVIRTVGQHFTINVVVQCSPERASQGEHSGVPELFLGLNAPSPIRSKNDCFTTWHKIEPHNIVARDQISCTISINFGKFWKCGFFDWRIIEVNEQGKFVPCQIVGQPDPVFPFQEDMNNDFYDGLEADENQQNVGSLAQGRFIAHARGMRDHTFHEVQVDYVNAEIDKTTNEIIKRGNFKDLENAIDQYARQGVTALYLMGTLERDNCPFKKMYTDVVEHGKEDTSPMAVTTRDTANRMLGGD